MISILSVLIIKSKHDFVYHLSPAEVAYYENTNDKGAAPYAFHHIEDFTNDTDHFKSSVTNTTTKGNVDSPEAGLDALMQAIVCQGSYVCGS